MSKKVITLENLAEFKLKCDETYATMEDSGIINLGQLASDGASANFNATITEEVFNTIPQTGIAIIMFNTTCAMLPYVKGQDSRFVCSAIYDRDGNSMVTRGKLLIYGANPYTIYITFDDQFSDRVVSLTPKPYGIIRFIGL